MVKEKQKPLTREDVLRLIEENGGTAEGLDLSGKTLADGIDLSKLELSRIVLKNVQCFPLFWVRFMSGVYFEEDVLSDINPEEVSSSGAHLEKARLLYAHLEGVELPFSHFERSDLSRAHLEGANLAFAFLQGASLIDAHLEGARLTGAWLEGAALGLAHLEGASLGNAKYTADTKLEGVDWGNYILGEEKRGAFPLAAETYRRLKVWYTNAGYHDTAAKFYYREKEANRKSLKLFSKSWNHRIASQLSYWVFGHGEGWKRILFWIAGLVLLFAFIYYKIGTLTPGTFLDSLYYSAASFVALGYGAWVEESIGWAKGIGVAETFLGFFMMTLLLVTFVRKWTR